MMVWLLAIIPGVSGGLLWLGGNRVPTARRPLLLGGAACVSLSVTLVLAILATAGGMRGTYDLGGGLELSVASDAPAGVVAILVPAITAIVTAYAAVHEPASGLARLLGLLTAFAGAMLLLVTAADLVLLLVGFELVGALSWALIGHDRHSPSAAGAAAHAFNVSRASGLGLFAAAGVAFSSTGSFTYEQLSTVAGWQAHVLGAGVLLAAAAKSAQGPFAPWLFSAMAGPTPVSALLHSSTMVAAGVYALARLHAPLSEIAWFAPATITLGMVTAITGGAVALLQPHIKKLLAGSTSAQYGLMLVAIGAGFPAVALLHLVVHAVFKAQLFLAAGTAIRAAASEQLGAMRLGRQLRTMGVLSAVAALALAAVPPLGGAASKEQIVAAAAHEGAWLAALTIVAGGLTAAYAARFQILAFGALHGRDASPRSPLTRPGRVELASVGVLAVTCLALGALWLPVIHDLAGRLLAEPGATSQRLATTSVGELVASVSIVLLGVYAVWNVERSGMLGSLGTTGAAASAADWLGLPRAIERSLVHPSLALARHAARFDEHVLDAAVRAVAGGGRSLSHHLGASAEPAVDQLVRGVAGACRATARGSTRIIERGIDGLVAGTAWVVERGGTDAPRIQTGLVHHQFVVIAVGLTLVALAAVIGS